MIRRLAILLLLLQLGAGLTLAWAGMRYAGLAPGSALLAGAAAVLAVRLALTLNNFFLSWHWRSATPERYRIGPAARLRLFLQEFSATLRCSSWSMLHPVGWRLQPQARGLPVLLLHGYACNSGYWAQLSARLSAAGISHYAPDLEPLGAAIDDYVPQVQAAVEQLCAASGAQQVVIVGHSMGGLVARAWLRRHGSARAAGVITLGTPHHGTGLARYGIGQNTRQMQPGHSWLVELAGAEAAAQRALLTSIFSHHDNLVAPQESGRLAGARNLEFGAIGHVALGRAAPVLDCVMAQIQALAAPACGQSRCDGQGRIA